MKVTLISPYVAVSAIGIRWISSYLKSRGHTTQLIFLPNPSGDLYPDNILNELYDLCRDSQLIGISLTSNLVPQGIQLTKKIKDMLPQVPVVWGGPHPSLQPEESLAHADGICIGEGELSMAELVDKLEKGEEYAQTESFWFKQGDKIIRNRIREPALDLDVLGFPDYDFEGHYIKHRGRIVPMTVSLLLKNIPLVELPMGTYVTIATRGCPHHCTYCSVPVLCRRVPSFKNQRRRTKDHVIRELQSIKERYPFFHGVKFNDDNFLSAPTHYLTELLKGYKEKIGLPLHVYGIDPATLNETKMKALVDAGLVSIKMGIQTGAKKTKALYHRNFSNEKILESTQLIHQYSNRLNIPPNYDLILDNPWENEDDLLETFNLLMEIPRPYRLRFFSLTFFMGTELTERALRDGLLIHEDEDFRQVKMTYFNSVFYLFNIPYFPKSILRLLVNRGIRHTKPFSWLPYAVFPAFRLKTLLGYAWRDLKHGEWGRIKKFFRKSLKIRSELVQEVSSIGSSPNK